MIDIYELIQLNNNKQFNNFNTIIESVSNRIELGEVYYKLGYTYCRTYGDLEKSNFYYAKALVIFDEEELKQKYILTLRDIYVNEELRGKYGEALTGFERCFEMSKEVGYDYGICISYGGITLLFLHLDDLNNPKFLAMHDEINYLAEKFDSDLLRESYLLVEALKLIFKSRLKDQMKGQNILEKLKDSNYPPIKYSANEFLLISYLNEMIQTSNKEILILAKKLIASIKSSMKNNLLIKLRITILESKLQMIDGDLESTRNLLEELLEDISGHGKDKMFTRFADEIKNEIEGLNYKYRKWRKLIKSNASFKEIIDKAELKEYIIKARTMIFKINQD